jgi:hypothetical protein
MALTDQPYLPLYVDDWMNNNKLKLCSLQAKGLMIQIMCIMHKEVEYGVVLLKAKFKQTDKQIENFALQIKRLSNSETEETKFALQELIEENCLLIEGDRLICPRMIKDANLSSIRSTVGKTGGSNVTKQYGKTGFIYLISDTYHKHKIGLSINPKNRLYRLRSDFKLPLLEIIETIQVKDMGKAEDEALAFFNDVRDGEWLKAEYSYVLKKFALLKANTGIENVNENVNESTLEKKSVRRKTFQIPTIEEIKEYCSERDNLVDAHKFFNFYESKGWMVGKTKMKDWQACVRTWEGNQTSQPQQKETPLVGRMTQATMETNFMKFANAQIPGINE